MSPPEEDDLLEQLGALAPHDVTPDTAMRIARTARAALLDSAQAPGWVGAFEHFYRRFVELPLVFGACAVYLVWAAAALHATGFTAAEGAMQAAVQRVAVVRYAAVHETSERLLAMR